MGILRVPHVPQGELLQKLKGAAGPMEENSDCTQQRKIKTHAPYQSRQ